MKLGIVFEGGGMRGVYTAGVIEAFLEQQFYANYVIGVSAGASNGVSYVSKQRGVALLNTPTIRATPASKAGSPQDPILEWIFCLATFPIRSNPLIGRHATIIRANLKSAPPMLKQGSRYSSINLILTTISP